MNSDNIALSHSHISCLRDFLRRTVKGDQDDWKPFKTMRLELCCMDGIVPLLTVSTNPLLHNLCQDSAQEAEELREDLLCNHTCIDESARNLQSGHTMRNSGIIPSCKGDVD